MNLFVFDAAVGARLRHHRCPVSLNPLVGYVFNKQHLSETVFQINLADTHDLHTTWQGPYMGIEFFWPCNDAFAVKWWYKAAFTAVKSCTHLILGPSLAAVLPGIHSTVKARALGTLCGVEILYHYKNWHFGSSFTYWEYNNTKTVPFRFAATPIASGARLNELRWFQYILGFFIEHIY